MVVRSVEADSVIVSTVGPTAEEYLGVEWMEGVDLEVDWMEVAMVVWSEVRLGVAGTGT